jgi:hypothetical protein
MTRKITITVLVLLLVAALFGCAAGPNHLRNTPAADNSIAGFGLGLWHGVIVPITFVISLFNDNVSIYEVHNNGGWYNFGFLTGLMMFWGGGGAAAHKGRKKS